DYKLIQEKLEKEKRMKQEEEKKIEKEKQEKERIRRLNGFIKEVKGVDGVIELYMHKILIIKGLVALKSSKSKSQKEIIINKISSIKFKKATNVKSGYIKFAFSGGDESKKGLYQAPHDENVVRFNFSQQTAFEEMKSLIEIKMVESQGLKNNNNIPKNELDDLEKLAELLRKGIITEEEFQIKKKAILGF
ncbi:MAG: SHOCT domain-containing protein, partial [Candidatus Subteraquimicrobiales bacterium]|nr:SHOCT domain-containing protein [Candidatus Subteraquimicrobiales bacterium]